MTEIILTSGTSWTVPDDCTSAMVECIGGGQGGNATNGGAGGDYAKANSVALTPGGTVAIAIGAGGSGVTSGSQNAGGDTSFGTAALAKGGGSASTDVGDTTFAGGAGDASGAGGGAAGASGAGASASGTTPGAGDGDLAGAGGSPAATGLTDVEAPLIFNNTGSANTGPWTVTLSDVQTGDQIVVVALVDGSSRPTITISDAQSNTYSRHATSGFTSLGAQLVAGVASALADAASLAVSISMSVVSRGAFVVYHKRGATLAVDSADAQTPDQAKPANVGPYSTTTRAFLVWACYAGNGNSGAISTTGDVGYTTDLAAITRQSSAYVMVKSKTTTAALPSESFSATAAAPDLYWGVYPFTY